MNVLARWEESFHNIYAYQITTVYTLNSLQFYLSIIPPVKWKLKRIYSRRMFNLPFNRLVSWYSWKCSTWGEEKRSVGEWKEIWLEAVKG